MFKPKCPKCGETNINKISESFAEKFKRNLLNMMMPIRLFMGYAKGPRTQFVCRDDGFTWTK